MVKTTVELRAERNHVGLPPRERFGEKVPKGGSMCSNCEYLAEDKKHCTEKNFIAWEGPNKPAGSSKIPAPIDSYCSIWWSNESR